MVQLYQVMSGLYRISTFVESMGLSFNQYLIKDEKSILIHTGSATMYGEIAGKHCRTFWT